MDNMKMPLVQPAAAYQQTTVPTSAQAAGKLNNPVPKSSGTIKTVVIVMLSLIALTFIGLFVWALMKYNTVNDDIEGRINAAVAAAKEAQAMELEKEFAEREKDPYRTFLGPADYGELSFKYPKTWSVYVAADAANGGDYNAYMNPIQVETVAKTTINALRVTIKNKSFEAVAKEYQSAIDKKDSELDLEVITVAGTTANKYVGKIPNTEFMGIILIFKIRDKTAILQTDSMLFESDFNKVVETINFNA